MGKGHIHCNVSSVHRARKPKDEREIKEIK
jgi:hypothetical protein